MTNLPPGFRDGIRHFNAGRYFEAHEGFEESMDDVEGDSRWDLALALVQVSVGYHKWTNGHPGAARMLRLGGEKLAAFADDAWGLDVGALRRHVADDVAIVERGGTASADPPRIMPAPAAPPRRGGQS